MPLFAWLADIVSVAFDAIVVLEASKNELRSDQRSGETKELFFGRKRDLER